MYLIGILAAFVSPAAHSLSNIFDAYIIEICLKNVNDRFYANITNILGPFALLLIGPVHMLPVSAIPLCCSYRLDKCRLSFFLIMLR